MLESAIEEPIGGIVEREPRTKEEQGGTGTERFPGGSAEDGTPTQVKGTPVDCFLVRNARMVLEQE
jgi:hypothetical protein